MDRINDAMNGYLNNREISCASLLVSKDGETAYRGKWGLSDIASGRQVEYDSLYRLMSMTKCVVAVGVMRLVERGILSLDAKLSDYIPAFSNMRVADDPRYIFREGASMASMMPKLLFFNPRTVRSTAAWRGITLRDLLSHSSGLEQGVVGFFTMLKDKSERTSLEDRARRYADTILGFQPGNGTGYSPLAAFDMLLYVCALATGQKADEFLRNEVLLPLAMTDTCFYPNAEQAKRLVTVYKRKRGRLNDVTGTKEDIWGMLRSKNGYISGSGGLFSTITDYAKFAAMLCDGGKAGGEAYLSAETVKAMGSEAPDTHLEPSPGLVWGLGMQIRQDPVKAGSPATAGTFGWSGAFGTHFFVSPEDNLYCVFMTNRTDLNGAGSYISAKVEELVFGEFGKGR